MNSFLTVSTNKGFEVVINSELLKFYVERGARMLLVIKNVLSGRQISTDLLQVLKTVAFGWVNIICILVYLCDPVFITGLKSRKKKIGKLKEHIL